jgi:hypothetical protein
MSDQLLSHPERSLANTQYNAKVGERQTSPPSEAPNAATLGKRPAAPSSLQQLLSFSSADPTKRQKIELEPTNDDAKFSQASIDLTKDVLSPTPSVPDLKSTFSPKTFGDTKYSHPVHQLSN